MKLWCRSLGAVLKSWCSVEVLVQEHLCRIDEVWCIIDGVVWCINPCVEVLEHFEQWSGAVWCKDICKEELSQSSAEVLVQQWSSSLEIIWC